MVHLSLQAAKEPRQRRYGVWSQRTLKTLSMFMLAPRMICHICPRETNFVIVLFQTSSWFDIPVQVAAWRRASRVNRSGFKAGSNLLCKTGMLSFIFHINKCVYLVFCFEAISQKPLCILCFLPDKFNYHEAELYFTMNKSLNLQTTF